MDYFISVIIPTWNRENEAERAVKSVLKQTFQDFEVLIADDGSTDQTEKKFKNYPDKRVKYLRLNHSGLPAAARNAALHKAQGDWVAFLDSDDEWEPNKLTIQIDYIKTHPDIGLVCTNAYVIRADKQIKLYFGKTTNIEDTFFSLLYHSNFIITSSVLARRKLLLDCGGFSEDALVRGIEDYDLWTKVCINNSFHYIKKPLIKYTDNPSQSVRSKVSMNNYSRGMLSIYERTLHSLLELNIISNKLEGLLVERIHSLRRDLIDWNSLTSYTKSGNVPEVSIILPVYNGEEYILESVFSILQQTYQDFELIIIDDGSTDRTKRLLETIPDPRVRVVTQNNRGIVASLNRAIELSRGKFIARQDHDDFAYPTRIEKQVGFLEQNPEYGLVGTSAEVWNENNSKVRELVPPATDYLLRKHLLFGNPFVHSSTMFRKSIIETVGPYDTNFAFSAMEDYELWSRISRVSRIANLPEVLQVYRELSTSISRTKKNNFKFREIVTREYFSQLISIENKKTQIKHLTALAFDDSDNIDQQINFSDCRSVYWEAINSLSTNGKNSNTQSYTDDLVIINDLGWAHFGHKIHFSWKIIHGIDKHFGFPLLNYFEKWETKSPKRFNHFAVCVSRTYEMFRPFLLNIKRVIIKIKCFMK